MKQQPLPPTAGTAPFYGSVDIQVEAWVTHINQAIALTPVDQNVVEVPAAPMRMSSAAANQIEALYKEEGWGRPCYEMLGPEFIVLERARRGKGFLLYRPLPENT